MEIVKELNINENIQSVKNNSLVCAKNIKISSDGTYITNEEGFEAIYTTDHPNIKIVGIIPCNKELIIFLYNQQFNTSTILRYSEITKTYKTVPANWKYSFGVINGTYTYNVNNELIIGITEYRDGDDIPLKTINIDLSNSEDSENSYVLNPDIPASKLNIEKYSNNKTCKKGTYYFFIRYKLSFQGFTKWTNIGAPIITHNVKSTMLIKHEWKGNGQVSASDSATFSYSENEFGKNPILNIEINNTFYDSFEIAYIVDSDTKLESYIYLKENLIKNSNNTIRFEFVGSKLEEVSLDDLLAIIFNIDNIKHIYNYNNRLYISNYKERDVNKDFNEDTSHIHVSYEKIEATDVNIITGFKTIKNIDSRVYNKTLIPGEVYSFYIHYVYPDGSFTNGCRINNNTDNVWIYLDNKRFDLRKDTLETLAKASSIEWHKNLVSLGKDLPLYYVFNNANINDSESLFGYYKNEKEEVFFRAPDVTNDINYFIVPKFSFVLIPKGFIGAFISYEEVESIVKFRGVNTVIDIGRGSTGATVRLTSQETLLLNKNYEGIIYRENELMNASLSNIYNVTCNWKIGSNNRIYDIGNSLKLHAADSISENIGKEFAITCGRETGIGADNIPKQTIDTTKEAEKGKFVTSTYIGDIIAIDKYIYTNPNKKLISTGYIIYKDKNINQGVEISQIIAGVQFNLPGYISLEQNITYRSKGAIIDSEGNVTNNSGDIINTYIQKLSYYKYSSACQELMTINVAPEILVNTFDFGGIQRYINTIVKPDNSDKLFKLKNEFITNYVRTYSKYDKTNKYISNFNRVIRRSDVIQTESFTNAWRNFRPDAYKIISENKGDITNIVGVGIYLLVHTEHSLFMFNRDASLKTKDKDVQLMIPDAFDVDYQEILTSDKGYGGLQNPNAWIVNEYGYTFFDNDSKKLYTFDNGTLNIMSLEIVDLLESLNISDVSLANDNKNNRFLLSIKYKVKEDETENITISYNYLTKSWISLHDYSFNKKYNTKDNIYYLSEIPTYEGKGNSLYTYSKNTIANYGTLGNETSSIFPVIKSNVDKIYNSYVDIIFNLSYEEIKSLEYITYILNEITEVYNKLNVPAYNKSYSGYKLLIYSDCTNSGEIDIDVSNIDRTSRYKYPYYDNGRWNFNYFRNVSAENDSDYKSLLYGKYFVARFIFDNSDNKKVKIENIEFNVNKY